MDPQKIAADMIGAATSAAGAAWKEIQTVAAHELKVLATSIVDIGLAVTSGQMKKATALILFRNARSQLVAVLALLSTLLAAAAEKIVKAALNVVKAAVNGFVGFPLIS